MEGGRGISLRDGWRLAMSLFPVVWGLGGKREESELWLLPFIQVTRIFLQIQTRGRGPLGSRL
jgi:hypothetical protein